MIKKIHICDFCKARFTEETRTDWAKEKYLRKINNMEGCIECREKAENWLLKKIPLDKLKK